MAEKKYIYADEESIKEIDKVLNLASQVLETDSVFIKDKTTIPPIVGGALTGAGGAAALGLGSAATAGTSTLVAASGAPVGTIALPVAVIAGVGFLIFKNKKEKKLLNMKLARYKVAVEKQNQAIKKLFDLDRKREQKEKELLDNNEALRKENVGLRNKLNELRDIVELLMTIIANLEKDLVLDIKDFVFK